MLCLHNGQIWRVSDDPEDPLYPKPRLQLAPAERQRSLLRATVLVHRSRWPYSGKEPAAAAQGWPTLGIVVVGRTDLTSQGAPKRVPRGGEFWTDRVERVGEVGGLERGCWSALARAGRG